MSRFEPIPEDWGWLDSVAGELDEDFQAAAREQPASEPRPEVNELSQE